MWIDSLSSRSAVKIAQSLGNLMYKMLPSRRKIAIENIIRSGITSSSEQANLIAKKSFEHFATVIAETLKAQEFTAQTWLQRTSFSFAPETMELLRRKDTGVILASGHIGNWEVSVQILSYLKPIVAVRRAMNNPYVERLLIQRCSTANISWTYKHDTTANRLVHAIRNNSVLALMMDQYAGKYGIIIDFFGHPASTHSSPAVLHLLTRAPLFFAYSIRTGLMQYKVVGLEPVKYTASGNREMDIQTIMKIITNQLETAIRTNPEQYLWMHRRWRT
jgi:KDO2-lipid IV(A) lauroyltransferase